MLPKLTLSITSYIPLYILMISMYINTLFSEDISKAVSNCIIISIIIVTSIETLSIIYVNSYIKSRLSNTTSSNEIEFYNITEDKEAHLNYMLTYLLPLMIFNYDSASLFTIIFENMFILLFVFMNASAEKFNFNIILWIKGYRVYTGFNKENDSKSLLIRKSMFPNIRSNQKKLRFVSCGGSNDIYICKKYNS